MAPNGTLPRLIGGALRRLRLVKGLSQRDLAALAGGIDVSYVGRVERGAQLPSLKVLQRLARALGVPVSEFFATETAPAFAAGSDRMQLAVWRALRHVAREDLSILLAVTRLLARRKDCAGRGPTARQPARVAGRSRRYRAPSPRTGRPSRG